MDTLARTSLVKSLAARFDRAAIEQLRAEVARLADQNEQLRADLARADDCAEFWREQAFELQLTLCDVTVSSPGITATGQLVTTQIPQ